MRRRMWFKTLSSGCIGICRGADRRKTFEAGCFGLRIIGPEITRIAMCNYSAKLIAWLDHELPENEASDLEQHVQGCAECRRLVGSYEATSDLFDRYCEAVLASEQPSKMPVWTPVALGAAVTAAV